VAFNLKRKAPASEDAGRMAQEAPTLDVGTHLVLTYGRPVLSICAIAVGLALAIPSAPGNLPKSASKLQFSW